VEEERNEMMVMRVWVAYTDYYIHQTCSQQNFDLELGNDSDDSDAYLSGAAGRMKGGLVIVVRMMMFGIGAV